MVDVGQGEIPGMVGENDRVKQIRNAMNDVYVAYETSVAKTKGIILTSEDFRSIVSTILIIESPRGTYKVKPESSPAPATGNTAQEKKPPLKIAEDTPTVVKIVKSEGTFKDKYQKLAYKFDVLVAGVAYDPFTLR